MKPELTDMLRRIQVVESLLRPRTQKPRQEAPVSAPPGASAGGIGWTALETVATVVSSGSATASTSVNIGDYVPAEASWVLLEVYAFHANPDNTEAESSFRKDSDSPWWRATKFRSVDGVYSVSQINQIICPVAAQSFDYSISDSGYDTFEVRILAYG